MNRLIDRHIEIEHLALRHQPHIATHRDRIHVNEYGQHWFAGQLADLAQTLAGHETDLPLASRRMLERDYAFEFELFFSEHVVGHLLRRVVDAADDRQPLDRMLKLLPEHRPTPAANSTPSRYISETNTIKNAGMTNTGRK